MLFQLTWECQLLEKGQFLLMLIRSMPLSWVIPKTLYQVKSESAGYGVIPLGLSARFGPAKFNFEFRMVPKGNFEFGYFDRSYEVERATFQSISGNQGTIVPKIRNWVPMVNKMVTTHH